jgi:hypothetical protein
VTPIRVGRSISRIDLDGLCAVLNSLVEVAFYEIGCSPVGVCYSKTPVKTEGLRAVGNGLIVVVYSVVRGPTIGVSDCKCWVK